MEKTVHNYKETPPETGIAEKHYTLKETPINERPVEKLLHEGADKLSDMELLGIIIYNGTPQKTAIELAQEVINKAKAMNVSLIRMPLSALKEINGIGEKKAAKIMASFQLAYRHSLRVDAPPKSIISSENIYDIMAGQLEMLDHEELWVLYLDRKNRLIMKCEITKGSEDRTLFDLRTILRKGLETKATAVILVHNHPTGTLQPSRDDEGITQQLKTGCEAVGIRLLDHLIIGNSLKEREDGGNYEGRYYSFTDNGKL